MPQQLCVHLTCQRLTDTTTVPLVEQTTATAATTLFPAMRVEWHCLPSWRRLSVPATRPTTATTTNDPATTANAASEIAAAIVPTTFATGATGAAVTAFATATSNSSTATAASSATPAASAARATAWLSQYVYAR